MAGRVRTPVPLAILLGALIALWLAAILFGGPQSAFDRRALAALHAGRDASSAAIFLKITHLGGWMVLVPLSSGAAVWLALRRRTCDAILLLAAIWSARAVVELQKLWIGRARPEGQHLIEVHSASFPSGHAANALVTYVLIAALLWGARAPVAIALSLAFVIGLSRPVLGVHWPSDVIGGWAFGLLWAIAAMSLRRGGGQCSRALNSGRSR